MSTISIIAQKPTTNTNISSKKSKNVRPIKSRVLGKRDFLKTAELINGRCAMLGYTAGYGYEFINHTSLQTQFQTELPEIFGVSLLVALMSLSTSNEPNDNQVVINGLTPEAELFNGRAAIIGLVSTLAYECMSNSSVL